ncbi:hypothetical protein BZA05DRAFT_385592 [Tricharina praecox]|uniref:uncharacterized protein n=1 Tax=Tricharina praecox TaxID=43433 RepID=UPI002220B8F9|nr:uncharacterized protein BZA05DRAFT_385592 [Tricharina praecox]KAI5858016.1 hypothetical protein BZA05DRAFT_385592 [Tricharina praecox]
MVPKHIPSHTHPPRTSNSQQAPVQINTLQAPPIFSCILQPITHSLNYYTLVPSPRPQHLIHQQTTLNPKTTPKQTNQSKCSSSSSPSLLLPSWPPLRPRTPPTEPTEPPPSPPSPLSPTRLRSRTPSLAVSWELSSLEVSPWSCKSTSSFHRVVV